MSEPRLVSRGRLMAEQINLEKANEKIAALEAEIERQKERIYSLDKDVHLFRQELIKTEAERDRLEETLRFVAGDGANARTVCDLHPNGVWILSDEQKSLASEALGEL